VTGLRLCRVVVCPVALLLQCTAVWGEDGLDTSPKSGHGAFDANAPKAVALKQDLGSLWTMKMSGSGTVTVTNTSLSVVFTSRNNWTISTIECQGQMVVGQFGSNGSVMRDVAGIWYGTGHGKETVSSFEVIVDGASREFVSGTVLTGTDVVLRKQSTMGYLDHEARITFPASGDRLIQEHDYVVREGYAANFRFLYAFMHMNCNDYNLWLAQLDGDQELEGQAGHMNNAFSLERDVKAVTFYSPSRGRGVSYVYPEVYPGDDFSGAAAIKNSIWDRRHDNKLYFNPDLRRLNLNTGDRFGFRLDVIPFAAEATKWRDIGRGLSQEGIPRSTDVRPE